MQFKRWMGAVVAALASPIAMASPVLSLSDGTTTVLCQDGAACDANGAAGAVTFIGSVGLFAINVSTGLGDAVSPANLIDLNSVNAGFGAGTLTIRFSDTGYQDRGTMAGNWGGVIGSGASVSASAYAGLDNLLFSESLLLGTLGAFSGGAFSDSFIAQAPATGTYSLTQNIVITATGPMTYSGNFEMKVPEPDTLALAGLAFAVAGVAARRRKAA